MKINNFSLVDTVSHDFKVALQRARQEKKMTQADLAQVRNFLEFRKIII